MPEYLFGVLVNSEDMLVSDELKNFEQIEVTEARLCLMLEKVQMIQGFERIEIEKLAQYCKAYKVGKGKTIFKEGEKSHFMCLIVDGSIDIFKENKHIVTVRAGKSMGEMSILDGFPNSATAISAIESEHIIITRYQFERLCETNPYLGLKLYRVIGRLMSLRLRQTTGILVDYL